MIIAIVAALAVPTLAAPFLGGGQNEWVGATETVGTVPVKMEIAKYCAITLPDQIVLTEAVGQSWGNEWGGEDDGSIVTNFDVTLEATIVEDGVADLGDFLCGWSGNGWGVPLNVSPGSQTLLLAAALDNLDYAAMAAFPLGEQLVATITVTVTDNSPE